MYIYAIFYVHTSATCITLNDQLAGTKRFPTHIHSVRVTELRIDPSHVLISWGEVSHNLPKEIGRNIISLCNSKGLDIKYQNMLQLLLPYFRTPEDHFFILVLLISRLTNTFGGSHRCEKMNRYFKIKSAFLISFSERVPQLNGLLN